MGIFDKGVKKTNMNFFQKLGRAIVGKSKVDDDVLDALEEALLSSDMGVDTTLKVTTKGMRIIEKNGLDATLKEAQKKGYVNLV